MDRTCLIGRTFKPEHPHAPLDFEERPLDEMLARADTFYRLMDRRRSVRAFSDRPVPRELIERAVQTAGTAPSGAHQQPWRSWWWTIRR